MFDWLFREGYRQPINFNLSTPIGHLNVKNYRGRFKPVVIFAAFLIAVVPLGLWAAVAAFGAVFGLFGLVGPSVLETIAILFVLAVIGEAVS